MYDFLDDISILALGISELELPARAENALERGGFLLLGDLYLCDTDRVRGLGVVSKKLLEQRLKGCGLRSPKDVAAFNQEVFERMRHLDWEDKQKFLRGYFSDKIINIRQSNAMQAFSTAGLRQDNVVQIDEGLSVRMQVVPSSPGPG